MQLCFVTPIARRALMPPTIIYRNASNWVDRGEPANRMLRLALGHFCRRFATADEPWLEQHA